jgi:hypothetical protein
MPELDYAFLCDYVRSEGGVAHVIGAGIDTVFVPQVPSVANLGLLARITFTRTETGRPHRIEAILADTDGQRIAHLEAITTPQWTEGLPTGWRQGSFMALNFGVPLPRYGLYSLDILINDSHKKSIDLRVIPPPDNSPSGE